MEPIRVLVSGAFGRMGRFVVAAVRDAADMELVAAADPAGVGHGVGELVGGDDHGLEIMGDLPGAIERSSPDVMVDFTVPSVVMDNIEAALTRDVACVVGTTGLSATDIETVRGTCSKTGTSCVIAPNFSIGANLMMRFAQQAAKSFDYAEIIERHHENKVDAPSGTALLTARLMAEAKQGAFCSVPTEVDKAPGSRGGAVDTVRVHAVRMPGHVADQEVIFGGPGERLIINHTTVNRECFMPGVLLAIRQVRGRPGLTHGLEHLL